MIRFSLRNRSRNSTRDPADRPQKPLGHTMSSRLPPPSFLTNYDTLPTRRSDGLALHYMSYQPSKYFQPSAMATRRRHKNHSDISKQQISLDIDLDVGSLQRSANLHGVFDFVPLDKRIRAKIATLRELLHTAEQLGDVEVLKDLVGIHDANLANRKHAMHLTKSQIKEAKHIAGIVDFPPVVDTKPISPLVRKVSGKPIRHIRGRTVSALKTRTASMRSSTRANIRTTTDVNRDTVTAGGTRVGNGRPKELGRLSRKSSARLKRLGSAGSILIRRLSKVSLAEDGSTASSETPLSSTFDQETMKRLKTLPREVIAEYERDLKRTELAVESETDKLAEAKERLNNRRQIHDKAMAILDQFYGSLPGWENDPIARQMLPDTAEMTEAGLEAERDLANARMLRDKAFAAYEDHNRCLRTLQTISSTLDAVIERLEEAVMVVEDSDEPKRIVKVNTTILGEMLTDQDKLVRKCKSNAQIAVDCCVENPRVAQMERDITKLKESLDMESAAVSRQAGLRKEDFSPTLQVAKAALCDCKLAETFSAERAKMIGEDLAEFEMRMERCEEYVMLERVGILDQYHPA